MLFKFDSWFLEKCEKFSQENQRVFGIDCFGLAKISVIFYVFGMLMYSIGVFWYEYLENEIWFANLLNLLFLLLAPLLYSMAYDIEKRVKEMQMSNEGFANPLKLNGECRIFMWVLTLMLCAPLFAFVSSMPMMLRVVAGAIIVVSINLVFYFCACDPLKPAKSKVRQWIESFVSTVKGFLAPKPQPVPVPSR